jgi:hypothetical protein
MEMPAWHLATRGLTTLRNERDWPKSIALLNRADSDPNTGNQLAIEVHNRWSDWKKEGRTPQVDVTLMSPALFASFLQQIGFQWELAPQNLKGYQLHLRGNDLRWRLPAENSEHLRLIRIASEADSGGDAQSSWELLQLASLSRLTLFSPWLPRTKFSTRFPLAAYISRARSTNSIPGELARLDAFDSRKSLNPPVILTAALELASGNEAAAKARLEKEKAYPSAPLPTAEERLEALRGYVADANVYADDPSAWWTKWMAKGFPDD